MKPPADAVERSQEPARPGWIVLPRYTPEAPSTLRALSRGRAFMQLADNAFNYHVHGRRGFELLAAVVEQCECYEFTYSELGSAAQTFAELAARR
jgi:hypothetical protein